MTATCYSATDARLLAVEADACCNCGGPLPDERDAAAVPDDGGSWAVLGQLRAEVGRRGTPGPWYWRAVVLCGDCSVAVVEALEARRS